MVSTSSNEGVSPVGPLYGCSHYCVRVYVAKLKMLHLLEHVEEPEANTGSVYQVPEPVERGLGTGLKEMNK